MKMNKKTTTVFASALLASSILSACSSPDKPGQAATGTDGAAAGKPIDVSIMTMYYTPEPPGPDNVVMKEIEKRTNTKLKITWVSPNNYADKINVTLASGDIPDLILLDNPFGAQVRSMVAQGAFWDLTPLLKDYPNLMQYPKESYENTKQADGKTYGIPRPRPTDGGGFPYLRKDWLDNLKLEVPKTTDELYNVMKAFVEKDPDGNGKADTIGYIGFVDQNGMSYLNQLQNSFTKTNGDWKLIDGKLVNVNVLPEVKDSLVWFSRAFKEKLIPEDVAVMKNTQAKDLLKANRGGAFQDSVEAAWEPTEELRKTNPKADFLPLVSLNGYSNKDSGFFGMFSIPKSVPEAKVKQLLKLMDYGASEEGSTLANYGLKDVHYTEKDGILTATEQAKKDIVAQQALGQIFLKYDKYLRAYRTGMPNDVLERNKKIIDEKAKISMGDPSVGLYSETSIKVGSELNKKIQDMKTKVIMGKEPISSWDDYVTKLKNDPDLVKITAEMNDAYQKRLSAKK
ncbi:putative aldouronate transport system substrate-binding protein [Paenibacillus sp. 1_12]|uniref:extracellular solute-binding protein n=1 Tax=Paenibacillus sp. 1_12 TaxID=1566278 RepID=UPI0008EFC357|nr:extracellular solute-binding protein [Paenibacillus sp. 1_12]SFL99272.1 putative aldouronate transport system substrate-binding protein [Paenibacillus sp. 1_12]